MMFVTMLTALLLLAVSSSKVASQEADLVQISVDGTQHSLTHVGEDAPVGTFLADVTTSLDSDDAYCLLADESRQFRLKLEPTTNGRKHYMLVTASLLVYEIEGWSSPFVWFQVYVVCSDDEANPPRRSAKQFVVDVLDVNEYSPEFSHLTVREWRLREDTPVGTEMFSVHATDADGDGNGQIVYGLHNARAQHLVDINSETGTISTMVEFDYEQMQSFSFVVVAQDRGVPWRSSTASVTLNIQDVNDEAPVFSQQTYFFTVHMNQPVGTEVGALAATDADSPPVDEFQFLASSDVFNVDGSTGAITTKVKLDEDSDLLYHLTVKVQDVNEPFSGEIGVWNMWNAADLFVIVESGA
jgi:hypothetical protein